MKSAQRFWAKVQQSTPSECWEWTCGTDGDGYGSVWFEGQRYRTHRVAFFLRYDYWPKVVMHTCDNRLCCNPEHLRAGSIAANNKDKAVKGRAGMKLTLRNVQQIKICLWLHLPLQDIADTFGVNYTTIKQIKRGRIWRTA